MIQRLTASSLSFRANNQQVNARDAYEDKISENSRIAQEQTKKVSAPSSGKQSSRIPMQGLGEKLDITA